MGYRIEKKGPFTVLGVKKQFTYQETKKQIPFYWQEFTKSDLTKYIHNIILALK